MFSINLKRLALILVFPVMGLGTLTTPRVEQIQAQAPAVNDANSNAAQVSPKAKVKFEKPLVVEDVVRFKDKHNVKLEQLDSELVVGDRPIYGIYNSDPMP